MTNIQHEDIDKSAFSVALGKRLCELRNLHGKSQKDMAAKLGVAHQAVHKYETGEVQIPSVHLFTYSRLFKVSMAYLYGLTNESNDHMPELDKRAYHAASETMGWPDDLRKSFYHLTRQISKSRPSGEKDKSAEQAA